MPTATAADISPPAPFALPGHLHAKSDSALIADDAAHLADVAAALQSQISALTDRLTRTRRDPGRSGQAALERDAEIRRLTTRIRTLRRFGLDLVLGRMVSADGESTYVGRLGLTDHAGHRLLVDWRSPAAEPFFGATHGDPMGLSSRRRYRWSQGRIVDYWDEVYRSDGEQQSAAMDDQSAFIASLGASRSDRMRDVLGTIAADQDAIIRAPGSGALIVDGGPGTGKTVVALHRAAYLTYSDPQLGEGRGGVLVVGPHRPYLHYVSDVLPSLGEDGVATCTLADLQPEGATAAPETDPEVARLKSTAAMVRGIRTGIRFYEEPPTEETRVTLPWATIVLTPEDWAEAFRAVDPSVPHNEALTDIWDALVEIVADKLTGDEEASPEVIRRNLTRSTALTDALGNAWPRLAATDVVGDLWTVPAFLKLCAPWLDREEIRLLQRSDPRAWTTADLPLLDVARRLLGDADLVRRERERATAVASERAAIGEVIDHLMEHDDSELGVMSMLRHEDLQEALVDDSALPREVRDRLAGPFAHVVVDEAQELTDAEWQMVLARCPSASLTIVGDRAQARQGFPESWQQRLERIGLTRTRVASLSTNYRTPSEVMAEAEPVIRAALPDANVPTSIRAGGVPVRRGSVAELEAIVEEWPAEHPGTACVIGHPDFPGTDRVQSLTPQLAKGLEFDLVVLVRPEEFGDGITGAVDRYVAMTRSTRELVVLT
ncbi:AAA family ATPase [Ruania suaedae]|uniref:RNA polymerase recycling motor ATPase HelR n=1 Tax=Ruania suaedae TaxID=2897774 RepID=UPI001E2AADB1|nr:RNA polymerase recycling motor ATPase HelR [Ruania suaedae]UFU03001.1 AAA family ATPase [Ruania suaedae]